MGTVQISSRKAENNQSLSGILKSLDAECSNCAPTTPLECISRCQVYKLKNELRSLRETMDNPDYLKELFNVLKNETRFNVLQTIVNGGCSIGQLHQMMKKPDDNFSQQNLIQEHLIPLIRAGLVTEKRDEYCTTMFGGRLTELLKNFSEYVQALPAHSECHEEAVLQTLLSGPKKFEEIEAEIPPISTSRTLQRLRSTGLIETPTERDYVFFFKTIRDPNKETISASERKVYDALAAKGSSVGKLSKDTGLSPRRTYKCVKVLKGKKLIFLRKTPKVYTLTCKGEMLAWLLQEIQNVVEDTWMSSKQVVQTARFN